MQKTILLLSLLLFLGLNGCKTVTLYVIDKQDIVVVPSGTKVGEVTVDRDGYFISKFYMNEVMEAKKK